MINLLTRILLIRYKKKIILIISASILIISCNKVTEKKKTIHFANKISIDESSITSSYNINDLIEEIVVVPLQEQAGYYLGDIYKTHYVNKQFIIHDRFNSNQILLFDEDGKFNKRILGIGHGPLETLQIDDCWLNQDGTLDAYDQAIKKVYHYDEKFQLKNVFQGKRNIYFNLMRISNSDNFLAYNTLLNYNTKYDNYNYQLEVLNKSLETTSGHLPFSDEIKGSNILTFNNQFHRYKDTIRFIRPYDNIIYNFLEKDLVDKTLLDYKTSPLDRGKFEDIIKENSKIFKDKTRRSLESTKLLSNFSFFYGDWVEDSNHIVFSSIHKNSRFTSIYSKKSRRVIANSKRLQESEKYNIILPSLTASGDGYFIGIINSLYLKHFLLGKSVLDKYTDMSYNSFLIVKVKLKKDI